jgi:putative copper resistance protein D
MEPLVIAQIIVAAIQDMLFAIGVGTLACSAILGRAGVAWRARTAWRLATWFTLAAACVLYLWLQAAVMSGSPFAQAGSSVVAVLTQSHFGMAWTLGFAGVLIALLGSMLRGGAARLSGVVAAVGVVVYAAGKAAASHAADAGDFSLPEIVHVVHLCLTALWAGSVIVATLVLRRLRKDSSSVAEQHAAFCARLSHLATMALGVVVVTGIYNAAEDTAHATAPLLALPYGRILALKLVLVSLVVLLGGYNRMGTLPRLQSGAGGKARQVFDRLVVIEAIAMLAVLAVAAVLGHTSPSGS